MATIKSFTDLEQSKELAKILPLESADMMYHSVENEYGTGVFVATSKLLTIGLRNDDFYIDDVPCWSLAALLDILPGVHLKKYIYDGITGYYMTLIGIRQFNSEHYDNPVDACVEMIEKLHKLNLL